MTTKWVEIDGTHHIIDHIAQCKNEGEFMTLCSKAVVDIYEKVLGYNLDQVPLENIKNSLCTKCLTVRDEGYGVDFEQP